MSEFPLLSYLLRITPIVTLHLFNTETKTTPMHTSAWKDADYARGNHANARKRTFFYVQNSKEEEERKMQLLREI